MNANVFEEIDPSGLNEDEAKLSTLLQQAALALSVKAAGRLIVVNPDSGRVYWTTADALAEMVAVSDAAIEVYALKMLPQGADRALIQGHFEALMDSLKKLAQQAMQELERLGSGGAALVFTKAGESKVYELNELCASKERHLDELLGEIRVRERQLGKLNGIGGSNDAEPGKEPPGA